MKDLFGDKETCDTTLKVKDKEYKAHRLILMARSTVFAATFKHDTLERQTGIITISDCDPDSFQLFLNYLYRGQLEELTFLNALNLYYISDKYDVGELKEFCVKYLIHCLTVENICEIVVFAVKYNEMELLSAIQNFFNNNYFEILLTSDWDNLLASNPLLANKLLKEMSKSKVKVQNT